MVIKQAQKDANVKLLQEFFYKVKTTKRQGKVMRQTSGVPEMLCLDPDGGYIQHTWVKFYRAVCTLRFCTLCRLHLHLN